MDGAVFALDGILFYILSDVIRGRPDKKLVIKDRISGNC